MNYIRFTEYEYQERPNDETVFFGQSETNVFVHQLIEDRQAAGELLDIVNDMNETASAYADEEGYEITFTLPQRITIDGNDHIICQQSMELANGYHAVQQNLYFCDPSDGVFRIVQFGTAPLAPEVWDKQGEALEAFTSRLIHQMLAHMALPDGVFKPEMRRFVPVA